MLAETKLAVAEQLNYRDTQVEIQDAIQQAWQVIAPVWPVKNFIACNPLAGLKDLPFETAYAHGQHYFQNHYYPAAMANINRETIKWCQAYFDNGQASLTLPLKKSGLYAAWRTLAVFDQKLHQGKAKSISWLKNLPTDAEQAITACLQELNIASHNYAGFFTLLLTSLPGWSGYVKYRTAWDATVGKLPAVAQTDFLAMRLIITTLLWPQARELLHAQQQIPAPTSVPAKILQAEQQYQYQLLSMLRERLQQPVTTQLPQAQFVFCIDTRSASLRSALESLANVETFGCAGFFGLPINQHDAVNDETHLSCPVIVKPEYTVNTQLLKPVQHWQRSLINFKQSIKSLYQSLKFNFVTPFILADALGIVSGLIMILKVWLPSNYKKIATRDTALPTLLELSEQITIPHTDQCRYAESILRNMGLTHNFAPLVVICGHGSQTTNNAYAAALQCGACAGQAGNLNATVLAGILNQKCVRNYLSTQQIHIPEATLFVPALHDTTTDECQFLVNVSDEARQAAALQSIQQILHQAAVLSRRQRWQQLSHKQQFNDKHIMRKAVDWSETRPEWGLLHNAAFIIAPRQLTCGMDLRNEVFLHSYDWQHDDNDLQLATIMLGPLRVAHWINMQYLFSSLDNVAYGSGSKTTHNIVGKMAVMQGNASDLMSGLPLQSITLSNNVSHQARRLLVVIYAPRSRINRIMHVTAEIKNLFTNGWCQLACIEPDTQQIYLLHRDLNWQHNFITNYA